MAAIESVDIITIANVLGEANLNVVSLCTSSRINMWSKRKPVKHPSLDALTDLQISGSSGDYGISYPLTRDLNTIKDYYDGGNNGYSYDRPNGSAVAPYRLSDFKGYKHDANPPMAGNLTVAKQIVNTSDIQIAIDLQLQDIDDLSIEDFQTFAPCYFGVALYKGDSIVYRQTVSTPLSETAGSYTVTFTNSGGQWPLGTYYAVPFISTVAYTTSLADSSTAIYYPVPLVQPNYFDVISASSAIEVIIYAENVNNDKRTVKVTLTNTSTTVYTNIVLYCLLSTRDKTSTSIQLQAGEKQTTISRLDANATVTYTFTYTGTYDANTANWAYCDWGYALFRGSVYKRYDVMQQIESI